MAASTKGRLEANLCESCFEVFFSKKLFDVHVKKCAERRPKSSPSQSQMASSTLSKCASCRRIYLGGENLAKHVKKEHDNRRVVNVAITCHKCNKPFPDLEALIKHKKEHHIVCSSSAADATAFSQKREMDKKMQPRVEAVSQPKMVSQPKVVTISQPKLVPYVEEIPRERQVSTTKTSSKSKTDSDSNPECDAKVKFAAEKPETKPKLAAEVVSMPVLDDLMGDKELETVEVEFESVDIPTTSSPLAPDESSLPPEEQVEDDAPPMPEEPSMTEAHSAIEESSTFEELPTMEEPTVPTDKILPKSGDISASQQAAVTEIPTRTPAIITPATSAVTTSVSVTSTRSPSSLTKSPSIPTTPAASTAAASAAALAGSSGVVFACGSCNQMFVEKDMVVKHLAEKHGKGLTVKRERPSPLSKKLGTTLYACGMCDAKFQTVKKVKAHIERVHCTPHEETPAKAVMEAEARQDTVWSTQECVLCAELFKPSVRLRDIYMSLSEWTTHFYGQHTVTEKLSSGKRLELRPCHCCGVVFVNNATRLHHNAVAHGGADPEAEMKQKQMEEDCEPMGQAIAEITPKSLTAKARSRVIVDSLMKASLVSRSTPAITKDKAAARHAQSKVFAARTGLAQRKTNVVFKCSRCGGMFPDDPSFERHAREEQCGRNSDERAASPPPPASPDPPSTVEAEQWDVLVQRECSDCSKLMESCPRSFGLFVRRDVWEQHVNEVHRTGRWRCTGEQLQMHPCPHCPRLFLHPDSLDAHKTNLHDTMLGSVDQADVDGCTSTNTFECSRCVELVQNADGIRFLDNAVWNEHFQKEHKDLLLCDGQAGKWQLFPCAKCKRLFFSERDLPLHEARQAYMHITMPINAKVTMKKRGHRVAQETEVLYQCASDNCSFTSPEHRLMVEHFQQCRESRPVGIGETVLYRTVMVSKSVSKPKRFRMPNQYPPTRRLENVMQKLAPGNSTGDAEASASGAGAAEGESSETAAAVSQLLKAEPGAQAAPAVLELDPVTSKPFTAHALEAAEDVPEAAAEEETVAAEESQADGSASAEDAADGQPTRMDFACSVCKMRGGTKEEIAAHIRREHKRSDGTFGPPYCDEMDEQQKTVENYKTTYLCNECKQMAETCTRTQDLFFEKDMWIKHLKTTHKPSNFTELERLDLHECEECQKLFLSHASLKRHLRSFHEPGAENYSPLKQKEDHTSKHRFSCVEEGCTFKYHRITRLRTHLMDEHNFDLAVREVIFSCEDDFQEWKKSFELDTNAYFVLRSKVRAKRKKGSFDVRYFGCSRVMFNMPSYKENGKKKQIPWQVDLLKEDMVWRCPAFIKAEVPDNSTEINVSFCPNHYGHDMDPSFGRLTEADEAEIGGMLRAGLSIQDVLKRLREDARQSSAPNRRQRITEAEVNRIFEKYMGMKAPKAKRYDPLVGKAVSRTARPVDRRSTNWDPDFLTSYEDSAMETQDTAGEELSMNDTEAVDESMGAYDAWERVCGEEDCHFTTTSAGFLRRHLRQRHGFAMHIDTAGFACMKDFTSWKRHLEKRTCANYTCYKSVAPSDPSDPVVTRYYTCHRSGLNSLKKTPGAPPPHTLVLCTGYMKVRCDSNSGEVACEYCASHYGHDAVRSRRHVVKHKPGVDLQPIEFEVTEDDGRASPPMVSHFGSPERQQYSSPSAPRYSFTREDWTVSDQEVQQKKTRRPRGQPPKKRRSAPRRGRGGKRRRWEEVEEEEEEEEQQEQYDSFESD